MCPGPVLREAFHAAFSHLHPWGLAGVLTPLFTVFGAHADPHVFACVTSNGWGTRSSAVWPSPLWQLCQALKHSQSACFQISFMCNYGVWAADFPWNTEGFTHQWRISLPSDCPIMPRVSLSSPKQETFSAVQILFECERTQDPYWQQDGSSPQVLTEGLFQCRGYF